jgi:chemotaxis family two-component system response regulator Rcp1
MKSCPPGCVAVLPAEILLVEDNAADVRLMQEVLKECGLTGKLSIVRDGEQALAFLHQQGSFQKCPRPALILLDLNLPRKSGRAVLAAIKQDQLLRRIPVIVLSSSTLPADIAEAYDLHANCYIPKPVDLDQLLRIGKQIEAFWMNTSVLPAAAASAQISSGTAPSLRALSDEGATAPLP